MLKHSFNRHKSAVALLKKFFEDDLKKGKKEADISMPAHPTSKDTSTVTYKNLLATIKNNKHWGFCRVTFKRGVPKSAEINYWYAPDCPKEDIIRMFAHELGHLSGEMQAPGSNEEEIRADSYAILVEELFALIKKRRIK